MAKRQFTNANPKCVVKSRGGAGEAASFCNGPGGGKRSQAREWGENGGHITGLSNKHGTEKERGKGRGELPHFKH